MPRFLRPNTFFDKRAEYTNTTREERIAIQGQYDTVEQLEIQNKLKEEEIYNNRKNLEMELINRKQLAEIEADAIIEAEEMRFKNEEFQRKQNLCAAKNIDLNSIIQFVNYISSPSNELKQAIDGLTLELNKLKNKLIRMNNVDYTDEDVANQKTQINYIQKLIDNEMSAAEDEILDKLEDFTNFRRSKYNYDMEILFKQLNINFIEIEYQEEDKGTIRDYISYINKNKGVM